MADIIGTSSDPSNAPTLCNVLKSLANNIPTDYRNDSKSANLYFLGLVQEQPESVGVSATLPGCLESLFGFFWGPWRERFIGSVTASPENIFVLLNELKIAVSETSIPPPLSLQIGDMKNQGNDTLFAKAVLAQKVIGTIMGCHIPVSYLDFDRLVMHESDSISATIASTIRYVKGEIPNPPEHEIAGRLDEVHNLWKSFIRHQLIGPVSPESVLTNSLRHRLQLMSHALSGKELKYKGEQLSLVKQLQKQLACAYFPGGVFASLVNLSQILNDPQVIVDNETFFEWTRFIGNSCDLFDPDAKIGGQGETLFGLFNLISKLLFTVNTPIESLQKVVDLIGKQSDLYWLTQGPRTFWGIVNRLFHMNFEFVDRIRRKVREAAANLPLEYMPLLMRTDRMFMDIQAIVDSNQFDWADVIIDSLHNNIPSLIKYFEQYALDETPSHAHKAFWCNFEAIGTLNIMINAILGGGTRRIFSDPALLPFDMQSLDVFLNKINDLCIDTPTKNSPVRSSQLFERIGEPSDAYLKQTLTLNDRFQYLKKIVWNIFTFEYTSHEWYGVAQTFRERFDELYSHINRLSQDPTEANLEKASKSLGKVGDPPGIGSVFSMINLLFYKASSTLFSIILDKYKASTFELSIDTSHSLTKSLQRMKEAIIGTQTVDVTTEIDRIGEMHHHPFVPSVFGRVAACEDALLQMWNGTYYIPIYDVLSLAAQFYEITHDVMARGWTKETIAKIGSPVSNIDEPSLFGTLNSVIASCLTSPLGHNIKYIADMMPKLIELLQQHPGMTPVDKVAILTRLIPVETLRSNFPGIEIPDPNYFPLAELEKKISNFFYPIAGFFRFHQVKQLWNIEQTIKEQLESVMSFLTDAKTKFDSLSYLLKPEDIQMILNTIGTPGDIANWRGHALDLSVSADSPFHSPTNVSMYGLSNRLGIRLHIMYSTLKDWIDDPVFSQAFEILEQIKQKFYPGTCGLYYLTDGLHQIDQSLTTIISAVQPILRENLIPFEKAEDFSNVNEEIFCDVERDLLAIGRSNVSIATMLPHVLGSQFYEILRCADITEHLIDSVDGFTKLGADIVNLVQHLGYVIPEHEPELLQDMGSCDAFSLVWMHLAKHTREISDMIFAINSDPSIIKNIASDDPIGALSKINKLQLAIQRLCPPSIKGDLRVHEITHKKLHCSSCSIPVTQMENIHENVQEIAINLSHLANAIASHSESAPLRAIVDALTGGNATNPLIQHCDITSLAKAIFNLEIDLTGIMRVPGLAFNPDLGA
jgi:hypothetical protein